MSTDIIKEYLVKIGFDADDTSFKGAEKKIQQLELALGKLATTITGKVVTAFAGVGVALGTASLAVGHFASAVASADMQVEILSRRLFTTEANARALKSVMDSMNIGSIEELQDINLNPELRRQFMSLRQAANMFEPGAAAQEGLATIRSVGYELQRLGLIFNYFMLNVVGRLGQYLEKPIENIRNSLRGFEDWFANNFDKIADSVAIFLSHIVSLTGAFIKILEVVWEIGKAAFGVFDGLQKLPGWIKAAAAAMGVLALAIQAGPWGMITAAVSALTLLVEDYMVYKAGGESAFGKYYGNIESFINTIIGVLHNIDSAVTGLAKKFLGPDWGEKAMNIIKGAGQGAIIGAGAGTILPGVGTGAGALGGAVLGGISGLMKETAAGRTLNYLKWVAEKEGLHITSTDKGRHNPGSKHYKGQAIDFDHKGISDAKIQRLKDVYGLNILDERVKNNPAWSGPHFHASISPEKAKMYQERIAAAGQLQRERAGNTNNVTINVNGANDPKAVGDEVFAKMQPYVDMRSVRSAYL